MENNNNNKSIVSPGYGKYKNGGKVERTQKIKKGKK